MIGRHSVSIVEARFRARTMVRHQQRVRKAVSCTNDGRPKKSPTVRRLTVTRISSWDLVRPSSPIKTSKRRARVSLISNQARGLLRPQLELRMPVIEKARKAFMSNIYIDHLIKK